MTDWDHYLSEEDRVVIERGRWAHKMGFGERPSVLVIDVQYYMTGIRNGEQKKYPLSCGEIGWKAADQMKRIIKTARDVEAPVIYTRFVLDPSGSDGGNFLRKVSLEPSDYLFFEGTHGSEIVAPLAPAPGDLVVVKKKASAFFGTPVLAYLLDRRVDTVIVVGGSTSNCIRATVIDAASFNFRTIVPAEAVFDRIPVSHHISLFDMNRTFADVLTCEEVIAYLRGLRPGRPEHD
jgi:nicotinamidase-related amidase